ncbi:hypothetical protein [Salinibaculum rarum]|uniref:hypothetical protein n=1 Tax=Salinibaculum rarum TaxID=3058903 RepID=UPI0026601DDC|nr:hypothetical protein [Salinibaculum sp. KK48]
MRRRKFLVAAGTAASIGIAGCLGGAKAPPPRKSNVLQDLEATAGKVEINTEDDTWVMSRYDSGSNAQQNIGNAAGSFLTSVSFIGVASAKGKGAAAGRGVTGRAAGGYTKAPRTHHNRAWLYAGDYTDDWYEEHEEDVEKYPVEIATLGVAFLGSTEEFKDDKPGPGAVPWDETYENPQDIETYDVEQEGWYRVGAKLVGENVEQDFKWEAVDFKLVEDDTGGYKVAKQWKVSPRI